MHKIFFGAILLLSAALIAPAMAQTAPTPAAPPMVKHVAANSVLSSNLIGLNAANAGNKNIGEVKYLVLGTGNMMTGVILSVGGFLGMGEHYVMIDPSTIAVTYNDRAKKWEARVNATKKSIESCTYIQI